MKRAELEHAIRAACNVAGDNEIWVFGSQAILGEHPDAPSSLRQSMEVDVAPRHATTHADAIDMALGELSPFHAAYRFYVHGLPIESATLPEGWQTRTIPVSGSGPVRATGWCLEAHDLAASKLVAFREKDRAFVRTLVVEGLVSADTLVDQIGRLPVDESVLSRLEEWVRATAGG